MFNDNGFVWSIGILVLIVTVGVSYYLWISKKTNAAKQGLKLREAARRQLELE
jgi:hypothetical protein